MTVLYDANPNPTGKWGWWGDPNVTDEMIVDHEMRNKRLFESSTPTFSYPTIPGQLNPFDFSGGLAGKYMGSLMGPAIGGSPVLGGALGGLIGAGIDFFGRRRR
jgi:hypothetical protein